jgi:hypothetical protein
MGDLSGSRNDKKTKPKVALSLLRNITTFFRARIDQKNS